MKRQYIDEIKAIVILACALILLASFVSFVSEDLPWYTSNPNVHVKNYISVFGAYIAGSLLFVFGLSCYFMVVFLLFWSWEKFYSRDIKFSTSKVISFLTLLCSLSAFLSMIGSQVQTIRFHKGGIVGVFISNILVQYFGRIGAYIILLTLASLSFILIGEILISPLVVKATKGLKEWFAASKKRMQERKKSSFLESKRSLIQSNFENVINAKFKKAKPATSQSKNELAEKIKQKQEPPTQKPPVAPRICVKEDKKEPSMAPQKMPQYVGEYNLPSLDLLNDAPVVSSRKIQDDLMGGAKTLESTLADFGVSVRVADIERGPVITRYELEPAPGVKVQKITTLVDDIALAMRAQTVRIVAPIPGKNRVGIEVPNIASSLVYLKDVLAQGKFQSAGSKLTLALGKEITGKSLIADLSTMPHLLIAGTTGAGKTVCLNSIIMSMLFRASPNDIKFLLIDPKMVELSVYNKLPHALCPAVTNPKKVSAALNWVVGEMETRYGLMAERGVRNILEYNKNGEKLPYIVIIADELADLMQVAAKQIESAITRLAQLSRAVGIHLILATQRPSVDVITGVIKANFPARISFKVASKVDSRTVLDMNGAEALLGKGDMLFIKPGEAKPVRGQCSLVSDEEIQRVIKFIADQQNPIYDDAILQKQKSSSWGRSGEKDELYDDALRLVIETNQASVSILQRRMRLGYTRAARLIDSMEQEGMVGPYCGSKPREILVNREEWLMEDMKKDAK